ncbi:MAG: ABC transporter ATP-binding protein [bacterium]
MVETWGLGKTFSAPPWPLALGGGPRGRAVRALHDVTLRIERGEVVGLLGPNGAGKTTLLRILATLVLPSEGRAQVAGADLLGAGGEVRRAVGLAAGQERGFYWRLSGRDNLEFFAGLLGLPRVEARRRSRVALEAVDLLPHAGEVVERYSAGMRQRLGIARALLGDPQVLLLDEPTRSLDQDAAARTHALIRRMASESNTTVLLATHQPAEAAALCRRVAILAEGMLREVVETSVSEGSRLAERYRSAAAFQ